jgi:hypothetical protein
VVQSAAAGAIPSPPRIEQVEQQVIHPVDVLDETSRSRPAATAQHAPRDALLELAAPPDQTSRAVAIPSVFPKTEVGASTAILDHLAPARRSVSVTAGSSRAYDSSPESSAPAAVAARISASGQ